MRAHISKATKAKCVEKQVGMCVLPGDLTPYLQAGDIGIYTSFKANLSEFINTWKLSDDVQYTRGGNPRPPSVERVESWARSAWEAVPDSVVSKSVAAEGFSSDEMQWHIARHDVYGELFRVKWADRDRESVDDAAVEQSFLMRSTSS
ncbi:hypothetical protein PC128_g24297 [Phytophthora cactorum]|nr:hypothetical protein PC120_g23319 [Phytophthora cactorum]KAG3044420.1 hypothetical protein PC121_g21912 [Phytophthora cactorum]KAG3144979.1 hypothetical protein PC128_g24297 [Phytophthora cactorum]KAG4046451.1 hypothetical protein PC123_g18164 [Phytophthora cactorum]